MCPFRRLADVRIKSFLNYMYMLSRVFGTNRNETDCQLCKRSPRFWRKKPAATARFAQRSGFSQRHRIRQRPSEFSDESPHRPSRNRLYTIGNFSAHCNGRKNTRISSGYRITPDPSHRAFRLRRTSTADPIRSDLI